ncbi:hypothetical protein DBV08_04120 [Rhodococcus sp. KBW08]|nr:hypothetical protein DBV08_04120 [Rhodococcus sp. KBW08]
MGRALTVEETQILRTGSNRPPAAAPGRKHSRIRGEQTLDFLTYKKDFAPERNFISERDLGRSASATARRLSCLVSLWS